MQDERDLELVTLGDRRTEERFALETGLAGVLRAFIVRGDDEIDRIDVELVSGEESSRDLGDERVEAIVEAARRRGYELTVLDRRAIEGEAAGESLIVRLDRDPVDGDGTGVVIELELGVDIADAPEKAEEFLSLWISRTEELIGEAYPKARLRVVRVDRDREQMRVEVPPGLDPDDLEFRVDDLLERAGDEAAAKVGIDVR